ARAFRLPDELDHRLFQPAGQPFPRTAVGQGIRTDEGLPPLLAELLDEVEPAVVPEQPAVGLTARHAAVEENAVLSVVVILGIDFDGDGLAVAQGVGSAVFGRDRVGVVFPRPGLIVPPEKRLDRRGPGIGPTAARRRYSLEGLAPGQPSFLFPVRAPDLKTE